MDLLGKPFIPRFSQALHFEKSALSSLRSIRTCIQLTKSIRPDMLGSPCDCECLWSTLLNLNRYLVEVQRIVLKCAPIETRRSLLLTRGSTNEFEAARQFGRGEAPDALFTEHTSTTIASCVPSAVSSRRLKPRT